MEPIKEIKEKYLCMKEEQEGYGKEDALYCIEDFVHQYCADTRKAVKDLCDKAEKLKDSMLNEYSRLEKMNQFEKENDMYSAICGIDEAGRGPLVGPVVAAAVILPKNCRIRYVNDSKQISEKKRERLFEIIKREAVSYGIGIVSPERIDEINILQATYEAMRQAISELSPKPDLLLVDAVTIPDVSIEQKGIIKGDAKSQSIAAASILAKVTRDHILEEYDKIYPEYLFAKNKGYGAKAHMDALIKYGPTPIHRQSFLKKFYEKYPKWKPNSNEI